MIPERLLSMAVRRSMGRSLQLEPYPKRQLPSPDPRKRYLLYAHVPFCESLCPYCSFNRFPFNEERARPYFENLRKEAQMLKQMGYDFESLYIGGGTPTIMMDELCRTIDLAGELFGIHEVSCETNPNHLTPENIEMLEGRVDRLSVGVQSFDDGLLRQMGRYEKYGSGAEIAERIGEANSHFTTLNADMIYNFPAQTIDILLSDVERIVETGVSQVTFYPLMASPSVSESLAHTVGSVDYRREKLFYDTICELLCGSGLYELGTAWEFSRVESKGMSRAAAQEDRHAPAPSHMIDEYVIDYEEYPSIGSGSLSYLGSNLYVNTFSIDRYNALIEEGRMSVDRSAHFDKRDRMRYRLMMQLFGLRLDKRAFHEDFGVSIEAGLPLEMAYLRSVGAFATDTDDEITLTPKGRYLVVAMMRQFFIGVNDLRDQARRSLPPSEKELLFG